MRSIVKRKMFIALLAALCVVACAFGLVACAPEQQTPNGDPKDPPNYTPTPSEDTVLFTFQLNED